MTNPFDDRRGGLERSIFTARTRGAIEKLRAKMKIV